MLEGFHADVELPQPHTHPYTGETSRVPNVWKVLSTDAAPQLPPDSRAQF